MEPNRNNVHNSTLHEDDHQVIELLCRGLLNAAREDQQKQREAEASSNRKDHTAGLMELYYLLSDRFRFIATVAAICAVLFGLFAFLGLDAMYSATSKLYIMGQNSSSSLSDLQVGSYLTMDYQEVFKTWEVHEMVRKQLDLPYSYKEMQSMLDISNPSNTRVLYITVKSKDPQEATEIANAYADAGKKFILDTMDSTVPMTFSLALAPGKSTGIGRASYIVIGLLVGTLGAMGYVVIKAMLDNHPKTPEDILKYANLPTLAIIPTTTNTARNSQLKRTKGRREK